MTTITKKSVEKLQNFGYVFLRKRDIPGEGGKIDYAIMQSKIFGRWSISEKFGTKAARERRLQILDNLSNTIIEK